jgi:serine/threonine protein kinase
MLSIKSSEITITEKLSTTINAIVSLATWNDETVIVKQPIVNIKDKREAENLIKAQHPNVIALMGGITEGKYIYSLVFPYMSNGDLWHYLKNHSHDGAASDPVREAIIFDVLRGLIYLHSIYMVHRDIKCNNILLASDFTAKIADLGSARTVDALTGEYGSPLNYSVSTPGHIPPEHIVSSDKKVTYTLKGDIYSLGVVFSHLGNDIYKNMTAPNIDNKVSNFTRETCLFCFQSDPANRPSAIQLLQRYEEKRDQNMEVGNPKCSVI